MKICSQCKSDVLNANSHVVLKVVLCALILFIIPFGLFFFWIPLLIPASYECEKCGGTEVEDLDWREFEQLKDELRDSQPNREPEEFDYCSQFPSDPGEPENQKNL